MMVVGVPSTVLGLGADTVAMEVVSCGMDIEVVEGRRPGVGWDVTEVGWVGREAAEQVEERRGRYTQD